MKFNVRIEDEKHGENHINLSLSQALNIIADGMLWGIVTIRKSDDQEDVEEKVEQG